MARHDWHCPHAQAMQGLTPKPIDTNAARHATPYDIADYANQLYFMYFGRFTPLMYLFTFLFFLLSTKLKKDFEGNYVENFSTKNIQMVLL